jgi:DNA repair exonuclease SbcCD nuclease subunit
LTYESLRVIKSAEFIRDSIIEEKPDLVVNVGDTFHPLNFISQTVLFVAGTSMSIINSGIKYLGIDQFLLVGNHDWYSVESGIHSIKVFNADNMRIFDSHEIIDYKGTRLALCPHKDKKYLAEMDLELSVEKCDTIFAHHAFLGAVYSTYYKEEDGIDPIIAAGKTIISGHVHIPQSFGSVHYVGSTSQWRYAEKEFDRYPRGVLIYDTDTKEVRRIKNTRVKELTIISNIAELSRYSPDRFAVKYVGEKIDTEVLINYEHDVVFIEKKRDDVKVSYVNKHLVEPRSILKFYIEHSEPGLLELLPELNL